MKLFTRYLFIYLGLFLISINSNLLIGQEPSLDYVSRTLPRIVSPTADAAALGRYADYPVDISTGVPSIQVPIFNISINEFSLPISISYHASGNRVDDISSIVGLGWALNAGGCITRTVKSKADKEALTKEGVIHDYLTREEIDVLPSEDEKLCNLYSLESNLKDLESDIYSYNFNGYGGQFRYNADNKLVLSTYEDIKISGGPESGFIILTPDGNKYVFSDGDIVMTMDKTYKNSWYLNQIITVNSDTITFTYKETSSYPNDRNVSFTCSNGAGNWRFVAYTENKSIKYLDNIKYKNNIIQFNVTLHSRLDMRHHRLESIDIINERNSIIKKINLSQSYFISDGLPSNPEPFEARYYHRLKLDAVTIINPLNSLDKQQYSFGYNTTKLPPYFQYLTSSGLSDPYYSQDYWGYFNNAHNTHLIPVMSHCDHVAAIRNVDETYMQACILNKIIYPTGGRSEYEYQANTNRYNEKVGGLRIKKITGYADNITTVPSIAKTYTYGTGGFMTGWWSDMQVDKWQFVNLANGVNPTYTSNPVGPVTFSGGSVVKYTEVQEFIGTSNQTKTEYTYHVEAEEQYSVPSSLSYCFTGDPMIILYAGGNGPQLDHHRYVHYWKDNAWKRGELVSKIDYRNDNGTYFPIKEVINTWTSYKVNTDIVGLILVPLHPENETCQIGGQVHCVYQYFNLLWETGIKKLTKTEEKLYNSNGTISTSTDFEYNEINKPNGHAFVTNEISSISSNPNDKIWTKKRYLPEIFPTPSGVYSTMSSKNQIGSPLELIHGKKINNVDYYLGSEAFIYDVFNGLAKPSEIKSFKTLSPVLTYTPWSDARLKSEGIINSYDKKGNLLTMTKNDNIPNAYLWGHNKTYPVAQAVNASNIVKYTSGTIYNQITYAPGNLGTKIISFNSTAVGDIVLSIYHGSNPGTNVTSNFHYDLIGPSTKIGSLCLSIGNSICTGYSATVPLSGMPIGKYTLTIQPISNNAASNVYFSYNYQGEVISPASNIEIYYQGFEEFAGATASTITLPSYAGKYYYSGDYPTLFTMPNSKIYNVDYRYWDGTKWIYMKKVYTNNMVLSEGSAIDEIRIYPIDAQMTTYTYEPLIGMTSQTDPNGFTNYYEYDGFGRLKLVKDKDSKILKQYIYHYK